jgi:hypothetical protein
MNNAFLIVIVAVICVYGYNQLDQSTKIDSTAQQTLTFDKIDKHLDNMNQSMDNIDYKLDELIKRKENGK